MVEVQDFRKITHGLLNIPLSSKENLTDVNMQPVNIENTTRISTNYAQKSPQTLATIRENPQLVPDEAVEFEK